VSNGDRNRMGHNTVKRRKESPSKALVPLRSGDSVDVFERVLMKGAVVESVENAEAQDAVEESKTEESAWLRVSVAGVDLLNVQSELSWRSLDEPEEGRPASE
jgi:hypothetical protein